MGPYASTWVAGHGFHPKKQVDSLHKLIIISPGFPENERDTTCLPTQQLLVRAINEVLPDCKITIAALQYPPAETEYKWHGNTVISFNGKKYGKILRPLLWKRVIRAVNSIENIGEASVLSFWYAETAMIGKRIATMNRVPHYCWILGQDARKTNPFPRLLRLRPGSLIALSEFLASAFKRNHGILPAQIIPNAVDPGMFSNRGREPGRPVHILGVGSLTVLKQYHLFIEVVAQIKKWHPEIKAVLCGDGPERQKLEKMVSRLDLGSHVSFAGELPHEEVLSLMLKSRVLIHPSSYEGYSTACLEALYAGCHVISFTWAEKKRIDHWHVVSTLQEMHSACRNVLSDADASPVCVHTMDNSAARIIELLFDRK